MNNQVVEAPFKVEFEMVTPQRARELLDTQPAEGDRRNRSRSAQRVERYADDLLNNFWETTHQGIAIDEKGILMDGQHRLLAIVESGVSTVLMVCTGVPRATFWLMDGGFTRSAQSFLEGPYAIQRAALARTLIRLEEFDGVASLSTIGNGQYPSHRVLQYITERADVREYGEGFSQAAKRASDRTRGHFVGTSTVGLLVAGFIVGPERWAGWWEDVHAMREGEGLPAGNPVRALYRCSPVGGNMTNMNYMRAIYAAVKYRNEESLRVLRMDAYREVRVW